MGHGSGVAVPARELFHEFQRSTRLVYVTGENDRANIDKDGESIQSMHDYCMFNIDRQTIQGWGHHAVGGGDLSRALAILLANQSLETDELRSSQQRVAKQALERYPAPSLGAI